jgi:putative FmdB family regulatory protein
MPIYEYVCKACDYEVEALQKIADAPLKHCPKCDKDELQKKISAAAFRLSGSGWYETDFKSGKKKNLASSDDGGSSASSSKSDSGSKSSDSAASPSASSK